MQPFITGSQPHAPVPACQDGVDPAVPGAVGAASSGQAHVRVSRHGTDLAAILDPAINLVIWNRLAVSAIASLEGFESIHETIAADRVATRLTQALAMQPVAPWHGAVIEDIAALAASFAAIMAVTHVALRLERVTGDACKRWHTDHVSIRMICTYCGCGTQWIDRNGARQHALDTGAVGMFKGRMLAGDRAIVHRSPPIAGLGTERLVLVLDCPPPADTAALWQSALSSGRFTGDHRDGAPAYT